jgi:hypothetical protein
VLSGLDPQRLIVEQDCDRLSPQDPIPREPDVGPSNLTGLAHLAHHLAEAEEAPETGRFALTPSGLGQDNFWSTF